MADKDIVRVLRVIEYVGEREWVERTVSNSIHGELRISDTNSIKTATLGDFPECLPPKSDGDNNEQ